MSYKQTSSIKEILQRVNSFIHLEYFGGLILFLSVVIAITLANSPLKEEYHHFWETIFTIGFGDYVLSKSLHHWINDGLMAVFFFVVGLELKRELMAGELSSIKKAALPIAGALGGMIIPALIYFFINIGKDSVSGWGVPMATDIAFALGVLTLLGKRIPDSLKVFLTALAVADDLGAVLVIAFLYTSDISTISLLVGLGLFLIMLTANLLGIRNTLFYAIIGIGGIWLAFLLSGVHATIAGVIAALAIPARPKINEIIYSQNIRDLIDKFDKEIPANSTLTTPEQHELIQQIKEVSIFAETPLQKLEYALHPWVIYLVMPIFALANAGVEIGSNFFNEIINPISLGIIFGLVIGKFLGVFTFSWILVRTKYFSLPNGVTWKHIAGAALLAGIGFTMSLFISELAFINPEMIANAKYGILLASLIAGFSGFFLLKSISKKPAVSGQ